MTQSTLSQLAEEMDHKNAKEELKELLQRSSVFDIRELFPANTTAPAQDATDPSTNEVEIVFPLDAEASCLSTNHNSKKRTGISVSEAIKRGKVVPRTVSGVVCRLVCPQLVCDVCDEFASSRSISFGDSQYYDLFRDNEKWFFADMVTTFGVLCGHDTHREDMVYIDATLPTVHPTSAQKRKAVVLPSRIKTIVSVLFKNAHFAVMRLCIDKKQGYFYDGLNRPIDNWQKQAEYILDHYGIFDKEWNFRMGQGNDDLQDITIVQRDMVNCGPIACMVIWKLFKPMEVDLSAIETIEYRRIVLDELQRLIRVHEPQCALSVKVTNTNVNDTLSYSYDQTNDQPDGIQSLPEKGGPKVARLPKPREDTDSIMGEEDLMNPNLHQVSVQRLAAEVSPVPTKKAKGTAKTSRRKDGTETNENPAITDFFPTKTKTKQSTKTDSTTREPDPRSAHVPVPNDTKPVERDFGLYGTDDEFTPSPNADTKKQEVPEAISEKPVARKATFSKGFASPRNLKGEKAARSPLTDGSTVETVKESDPLQQQRRTRNTPTKVEQLPIPNKAPKRKRIVESDEEEWEFQDDVDAIEESRSSSPKKRTKTEIKRMETVVPKTAEKNRPQSLAIDGLGSSDDEDDKFINAVTPNHVKQKLADSQQKPKQPERSIKISMKESRMNKTPDGKCRCKKECTGHCGCVKLGRKCTVACGCRGTCNNGRSP